MTLRASHRLRVFLGELRAGADELSAAVVAEMTAEQGAQHAVREQLGEYRHVEAIRPAWSISEGRIQ